MVVGSHRTLAKISRNQIRPARADGFGV